VRADEPDMDLPGVAVSVVIEVDAFGFSKAHALNRARTVSM
jgi:hypothetical protein